MEEVRRRTSLAPLASPCFMLGLLSLETEGLLAFQGRARITFIVRWNLRPVKIGVELHTFLLFWNSFPNYTGHSLHMAFWQEFFGAIRVPMKVLSVNAPIPHINCLGKLFSNYTHTHLLHTKELFLTYLCNHFGPHGK